MAKMPAVRKNTLPVDWEKQMAADAAAAKLMEASVSVGQFMSTRGGILAFGGTPVPGNKMPCVVLGAILENSYYMNEFDPDAPAPPDCFAFGEDEKTMKPHELSAAPQSPTCAGCEHNKFGSAEKGRGKACKNGRRMGIMHADSLKGDLKDAQVAFLKIPPTSLPGWATYARNLTDMLNKPAYAVVTELAVVADVKSQFKVTFNLVKEIDKKLMSQVFPKAKEVKAGLDFPYQPADPAQQKKKPSGRKKPAGKAAKKKPVPSRAAPPPQQKGGGFGGRPANGRGGKF